MKATYSKRKIGPSAVLIESMKDAASFCRRNMNNFANVLLFIAPFLALVVGQYTGSMRGGLSIGGEYILALIYIIIALGVKVGARLNNVAGNMPIPVERFTHVDKDEVTVDSDKVNDLVLYVADLEDWLEDEKYV